MAKTGGTPFARFFAGLAIACAWVIGMGDARAADRAVYDTVAQSIVLIETGENIGTGFFIASDNRRSVILTAQHVIGSKKTVKVYANAGRRQSFIASVLQIDHDRDLALLTVAGGPFPTLRLATAASVGQTVAAGGFDDLAYRFFKSSGDLKPNFPQGTVNSLRRSLVVHNVPTDEGNSGGPLFDIESGAVIGVVKGSFNQNYYAAVAPASFNKFVRDAGIAPTPAGVALRPNASQAPIPTESGSPIATPTPILIFVTPPPMPTPEPTPTLSATEIASALTGVWGDASSSVKLEDCKFTFSSSVSYHDPGDSYRFPRRVHDDSNWTGRLRDVDPESITFTDHKVAFRSYRNVALFEYTGANPDFEKKAFVQIGLGFNPSRYARPFRDLVASCSSK